MDEPTTHCHVCLGEGSLDFRDSDAWFAEHHSDAELARMEGYGFVRAVGVIVCEECEGTGVVTVARARDVRAYWSARLDQIIAKVEAERQAV